MAILAEAVADCEPGNKVDVQGVVGPPFMADHTIVEGIGGYVWNACFGMTIRTGRPVFVLAVAFGASVLPSMS